MLREMMEQIAERVATRLIEKRFGEMPKPMEITTGPNGEIKADHNHQCYLKPVAASSTDDTSPVIKADNFVTPIRIGLRVMYGYNQLTNKKEVLGFGYDDAGLMQNGETLTAVMAHAADHEARRNNNAPFVTARHDWAILDMPNFYPFQVTPGTGGGVTIDVMPGVYYRTNARVMFPGVTAYDLSGSVPSSGLQRFTAVYINRETNTLATIDGSTVATGASRPPDVDMGPSDIIPLAQIRLYNGQTAIDPYADIDDNRGFADGSLMLRKRKTASFADPTSPTTAEKDALNVSAGTIVWQGGTADNPAYAWLVDGKGNFVEINRVVNVPYAIAGTGTQIDSNEAVAISDDLHFLQSVLVGGSAGDTPAEQLEVSGAARLSKSSTWHSVIKNVNSTSFPRLAMAGGNSTSDTNFLMLVGPAYSSVSSGITSGFQLNTSYDLAGESYRSNNFGLLFLVDKTSGDATVYTFSGSSGAGGDIKFTRNNGNVILYLDESAQAASIGTSTTGEAKLLIDQNGASAAIPVLKLNQVDDSEAFFHFDSNIGASLPIDTAALGTYYGKIRVHVEGVGTKMMALYNS